MWPATTQKTVIKKGNSPEILPPDIPPKLWDTPGLIGIVATPRMAVSQGVWDVSGGIGITPWRSGRESNPHTRICSPMHSHSATRPQVCVLNKDYYSQVNREKTIQGIFRLFSVRFSLIVPLAHLFRNRRPNRQINEHETPAPFFFKN